MTQSKAPPRYKLTAVSKGTKARVDVLVGFENERGTSFVYPKEYTNAKTGEVRPGVKSMSVTLTDGRTIDLGSCFLNFYDNAQDRRQESMF